MTHARSDLWRFARAGAVSRIGVWLAITASIGAAVTLVAWMLGAQLSVVGPGSDHTLLGVISFFSALLVMSRSDRGVGVYGLAIGDTWTKHIGLGLCLGAFMLIGTTTLAIALNAWDAHLAAPGRWISSFGKALGALPMAVAATLTYAGFVAGTARELWGRTTAVVFTATLFGAMSLLHPVESHEGSDFAIAVTRALIMATVVQMRFATGDVILGVAFSCGLLFIERFVRKTALLAEAGANDLAATILAPERFLLQAPAVWIALIVLNVALVAHSRRRDESSGATRTGVSRRFARSYPFATMGALATLDVWLPQLARAKFRIDPIYVPRLIATLVLSTLNTALTLPERLLAWMAPDRSPAKAPIFIVGAHRSGTTHLHNLMSFDPQFIAPTTWQVMNPYGFRFSGWLLRPLFEIFSPWKRPMDAVAFGMGSPAEDEFAMANMCGMSPDWSLRLPRLADTYDRFGFPDRMTEAERRRWGSMHRRFVRRVVARTGQCALLKNPHNTGRLSLLMAIYPGAKFVHIRRNPDDVIRSNAHLARTAHELFQMQDPTEGMRYDERYPSLYRDMETRFYDEAATLPSDRVIDIRYEDLAAHPIDTLKRMYDQLDLDWTPDYESRLRRYLERISGYRRTSKAPLTDDQRDAIERELAPLLERWRRMDAELDAQGGTTSVNEPARSA